MHKEGCSSHVPKPGTASDFLTFLKSTGEPAGSKKWGDGKFGTYFLFGAQKIRDSFTSFEAAWEYLDREFSKFDTDRTNNVALHPVGRDLKTCNELEQILQERGGGATLREAVQFYLNHREQTKFTPAKVDVCVEAFLAEERSRNHSDLHERTLARHLRHFVKSFGYREIHTVTAKENFRLASGLPLG